MIENNVGLSGQRLGRWLVLRRDEARSAGKYRYYWCRCDCGRERSVCGSSLTSGQSTSCGCSRRGHPGHNRTHGHTAGHHNGRPRSREYESWQAMRRRCKDPERPWYHGRAITVCARWEASFENFLADVGPKPAPEYTLERLNNAGNYEPGNVRWASPLEQGQNKRNNRLLTFAGRTMTVSAWARETGLGLNTIITRLERGWSAEQALSTPVIPPRQRRAGRAAL